MTIDMWPSGLESLTCETHLWHEHHFRKPWHRHLAEAWHRLPAGELSQDSSRFERRVYPVFMSKDAHASVTLAACALTRLNNRIIIVVFGSGGWASPSV